MAHTWKTTFISLTSVVQTEGVSLYTSVKRKAQPVWKLYGKKNLRKILILVHNFASTMMNYIHFVLVVEIIVKVEAMANSRNFAKKYGSKFTLVAVLWVGTPKMIRYFTFLMKAGNWNLFVKSIFIHWEVTQNLKMKTFCGANKYYTVCQTKYVSQFIKVMASNLFHYFTMIPIFK